MDVHSEKVRSYNMSMIKGKNTKPEEIVRKYLFSKGLRYRKNVKTLIGSPDVVLAKYKTVIFVNGCFWHGHRGCKYFVTPKTNTEFWVEKILRNIERDKKAFLTLTETGWNVIVVWECELKKDKIAGTLENLYHNILNNIEIQHNASV